MRLAVASITDLGEIVKRRRNELGWSIVETSEIAGTSRYFVADLERGKPSCQFDKIMAVLEALQLKLELRFRAPRRKPAIKPGDLEQAGRRPLATGPAIPLTSTHTDPATIGCLECGKRVRNLQRHLSSFHAMRASEYRRRWQLPKEYDLKPLDVAEAADMRRQVKGALGERK